MDSPGSHRSCQGPPRSNEGVKMLEYLLPRGRLGRIRRLLGPAIGRLVIARYRRVPRDDLLTEAQAEVAFDSRAVLPRIRGPILLIRGDRDQFFTREVAEETAALIPSRSLIWYAGEGPHEDRGQRARGFRCPGVRRTSLGAYQAQWLLGATVIRATAGQASCDR